MAMCLPVLVCPTNSPLRGAGEGSGIQGWPWGPSMGALFVLGWKPALTPCWLLKPHSSQGGGWKGSRAAESPEKVLLLFFTRPDWHTRGSHFLFDYFLLLITFTSQAFLLFLLTLVLLLKILNWWVFPFSPQSQLKLRNSVIFFCFAPIPLGSPSEKHPANGCSFAVALEPWSSSRSLSKRKVGLGR